MRSATWLLVIVAIAAVARAEPATGTVVISCNEADAELIVDGVLLPERTPAVLTLSAGPHVIEARKPPLVPDKKVIEVADQQQVKVRFELLPATPLLPPADAGAGSGSSAPPAAGSAAPPAGSGSPPAAGSAAPPAGAGSAATQPPQPVAKPMRCTEGGREVACIQGPHCTEGGRPVPCKKGETLPPPPPPITPAIAAGSGAAKAGPPGPAVATTVGAGSGAEPPHAPSGAAAIEIATTAPHAIAYVDGAPVRDAPCVLELEPGEHVIAVYAAGMLPAETTVHAATGKRQRVDLTPTKPRRRIDVPAQ